MDLSNNSWNDGSVYFDGKVYSGGIASQVVASGILLT